MKLDGALLSYVHCFLHNSRPFISLEYYKFKYVCVVSQNTGSCNLKPNRKISLLCLIYYCFTIFGFVFVCLFVWFFFGGGGPKRNSLPIKSDLLKFMVMSYRKSTFGCMKNIHNAQHYLLCVCVCVFCFDFVLLLFFWGGILFLFLFFFTYVEPQLEPGIIDTTTTCGVMHPTWE